MSKFNVGDKVKAYDRQGAFVGIVNKVLDGCVYLLVEDEHLVGHQTMKYFYTQQCRKLVKKERREYWIYMNLSGLYVNMSLTGRVDISVEEPKDKDGWIKVRECK